MTEVHWMAPYCCPASFPMRLWDRSTLSRRLRMVGTQPSLFYLSSSRSLLHTTCSLSRDLLTLLCLIVSMAFRTLVTHNRWPASLRIIRFLTLQITALLRKPAWEVGFLIMTMPCGMFFGTRFGEI